MKRLKGHIFSITLALLPAVLLLFTAGCKSKSIDQLLAEGKYDKAEKACSKLEANEQAKAYGKVASTYFEKKMYDQAAVVFDKAGNPLGAINSYYRGDNMAKAESYCREQPGKTQKDCAAHIGRLYYSTDNYRKAIEFFRLAGDEKKAVYIESKVPVYQLVETIGKETPKIPNAKVRKVMKAYAHSLKAFIHLEDYLEWPHKLDSPLDKKASALCEKAVKQIREHSAPTLIEKITHMAAGSGWDLKKLETAAYYNAELEQLIKLVKLLRDTGGHRKFFTKYSVVFQDPADKKSPGTKEDETWDPGKARNFEEVYQKVLFHADGLFDSIKGAKDIKDPKILKDYQGDLGIDMDIIVYIESMLRNVRLRFLDLKRKADQLRKAADAAGVSQKQKAGRLMNEFTASCNRILHAIGKGQFQEANALLTTQYETAKRQLK